MKFETKMEVDLKKLKDNTKLLCKSYSDYKYKMVNLKDNAHGLGLKVIDTMQKYGINYCLVGSLKDGLEIRKFNNSIPVLVDCYLSTDEIYDCINNNLSIVVYSLEYLINIIQMEIKDELKIHILIDNGSNLIGVNNNLELKKMVSLIDEAKYLTLEGMYTNITTLGVVDEYYYHQANAFYQITNGFKERDIMIHLNEPIMYHKKLDYVNGIMFDLSIIGIEENIADDFKTKMKIKNVEKKYGCLEFPDIDLKLVFDLTSEVMATKFVTKGCIIGRSYLANQDMYVALIPIGHKDGITKAVDYVGIKGYKRKVLADEIDYIVVEVTEDVNVHDKVYIINEEREIYDFLSSLHTNRYYLMSILNKNLEKVYINEEKSKVVL